MHPLTKRRIDLETQVKQDIARYGSAVAREESYEATSRKRAILYQSIASLVEAATEEGIDAGKQIALAEFEVPSYAEQRAHQDRVGED